MVLNLMTTPLPLPRPFLAYGGKGKSFQSKGYRPQGLRNPPRRVGDPEARTAENLFSHEGRESQTGESTDRLPCDSVLQFCRRSP